MVIHTVNSSVRSRHLWQYTSPQVIYVLNTKNEDHDAFVESLRRQYEEKMEQVEGNSATRLRGMEERVRGACEDAERRVQDLRNKLDKEKDQLKQSHVRLNTVSSSVTSTRHFKVTGSHISLREYRPPLLTCFTPSPSPPLPLSFPSSAGAGGLQEGGGGETGGAAAGARPGGERSCAAGGAGED